MYSRVTGPVWTPLGSTEAERVEKKFGSATRRIVERAIELGRPSSVWGLEKKIFRAALEASVPRDHAVAAVRSLLGAPRALKAARTYERLRGAEDLVPPLPDELPGERFWIWSSYCLKPRAPGPLGFELLRVAREDVPGAVMELWSRIFLESRLETLGAEVRRAEVAIGVAPDEPEFEAMLSELARKFETEEGAPGLSLPSLLPDGGFVCALEASFLRIGAEAFGQSLRKLDRRVAREPLIVVRASEVALSRPHVEALLDGRESALERLALELSLGPPGRDPSEGLRPARGLAELTRLSRAIWELLLRASEAARLEEKKKELALRVRSRATWMREMDLAILPDDGLKQTLTELTELTRSTAELAAESELLAVLHIASYLSLTGLPLWVLEAGLELPTLAPLVAFEEAMTRVRVDAKAGEALIQGDAPPEGPGLRALEAFYGAHREIFGSTASAVLPASLLSAARGALERAVSLADLLERAQVAADLQIAHFEENRPRPIGASLSPLRAQTRALIALREVARDLEVRVSEMVLLVARDVDRRLGRLEPGVEVLGAYYATAAELQTAVDMRGRGLRARTAWRRADAQVGRPAAGASETTPFLGLAQRRALPELLRLAYEEGPLRYAGRATDTLASSARMLGRTVFS